MIIIRLINKNNINNMNLIKVEKFLIILIIILNAYYSLPLILFNIILLDQLM